MFLKTIRRLTLLASPWLLASTLWATNPEVEEYDDDDSPPSEPCCPESCSMSDSGATVPGGCKPCEETGSVFFSVSLGRAGFIRRTDYFRAAVLPSYIAPKPGFKAYQTSGMGHRYYPPKQVADYYRKAPLTARKEFRMWIAQESIDAATYLSSALQIDNDNYADKIVVSGAVRQVLTEDRLADVQSLSAVRSSLPSDIQGALPTNSEGFVVCTWFAADAGTKTTLYALPTTASPVEYMVFFNPDAPTDSGRLNIIYRALYSGTSYKTRSYCYYQNPSTHDWTTNEYAGLPSDTLIKETTLDVTSWTNARDYTQTRTVKEKAISPSGTWGSLATVSCAQENFDDIGGTSRLVEEIQGYGTSETRTTKYGYFSNPADTSRLGRLNWKINPDLSFEFYQITFNFAGRNGTIVKKTPWKDYTWDPVADPSGPDSAQCVNETSYSTVSSTGSSLTVTTQVGSTTVGYETESWATVSSTLVHTYRQYYDGSNYLTTTTGYYLDSAAAHLACRIKWRELPDGSAETYAYGTPDGSGNYTQTVEKGAGSSSGITSGTRTASTRNKFGYTYEEHVYHFDGSGALELEMWDGSTSVDNFGRPTVRVWNGNSADYDETVFGCCGIASFRDRKGILTETYQDDLKRVRKRVVTAGSRVVTTNTDFNGLVTEVRKAAGSLDLLKSKTWRLLNGELEKIQTPDENNDSNPEETDFAYTHPSGGGVTLMISYPDGGTKDIEYYVDGRKKSVGGTAAEPRTYNYGVHTTSGNGTWIQETKPSSASPTGEWTKTYRDRAGRDFKTEYPTDLRTPSTLDSSSITYYSGSASAGSRGKTYQNTDPDGVVLSYAYDGEGNVSSVTEPMPGSAGNRVTTIAHDAVADGTLGNCLRTSTDVNGVSVSIDLKAGDGYRTKKTTFGRVTTTIDSVGVGGDWTEATTYPDGTHSVEIHDDGILQSLESRDSTGGSGNVIASISYTYDSIGRMASSTDSRTGTTTFDSHTESGNLLSETDPRSHATSYGYDSMGRRISVDSSSLSTPALSYSSYYPNGALKATWGDLICPTFRIYDSQRRMTELRSYRGLAHGIEPTSSTGGADTTTWSYHSQRGWLAAKRDSASKGGDYTYTAAGELRTRTWARGAHTRYDYSAGKLTGVKYFTSSGSDTGSNAGNDSLTPDLGYTYDAFGRIITVSRGGATHFTYTYDSGALYLATETQNDVSFAQRLLTRKRDSILRPTGYLLGTPSDPDAVSEITHGYDAAGRLSTLTYQRIPGAATPPAAETFTYGYDYTAGIYHVASLGGSSLPSYLPFSTTGPHHVAKRAYEATRDVLHSITNETSGSTVRSSYTYVVNDVGQRTALAQGGSAFGGTPDTPDWSYDDKGQVVAADSANGAGDDRYYSYDQIGNRKQSRTGTHTSSGGAATDYFADAGATTVGANGLNQYGAISASSATREPLYDDDGNLADDDANWLFTWDGENRLVAATPKVPSGNTKIVYQYDHFGRLFARTFYVWNSGTSTWVYNEAYRYVYDGWNRIESYLNWTGLQDEYVWGLDVSGSIQGAGGVGGMLLWSTTYDYGATWKNYYPAYDGNGNVTELINQSGGVAAHWEYDPFGNTLRSTAIGTWSDPVNLFEFRFSTKPQDRNTGLYYYGYRFYDPATGRWISRDPIGERGGNNLYGFVLNSAINSMDKLGLMDYPPITPGYRPPPTEADTAQKDILNKAKNEVEKRAKESIDELQKDLDKLRDTPTHSPEEETFKKQLALNLTTALYHMKNVVEYVDSDKPYDVQSKDLGDNTGTTHVTAPWWQGFGTFWADEDLAPMNDESQYSDTLYVDDDDVKEAVKDDDTSGLLPTIMHELLHLASHTLDTQDYGYSNSSHVLEEIAKSTDAYVDWVTLQIINDNGGRCYNMKDWNKK